MDPVLPVSLALIFVITAVTEEGATLGVGGDTVLGGDGLVLDLVRAFKAALMGERDRILRDFSVVVVASSIIVVVLFVWCFVECYSST